MNQRFAKFAVVLGFLGCMINEASAVNANVNVILQNKLNAIHTMSASFNQSVQAKQRVIGRSSGTMALSRPGHFRWQTQSPMPQLVVADGGRLWIYDKDLDQVVVRRQQKGMGGTAGLFLSGYNANTVARYFNVSMKTIGRRESFDLHSKSQKSGFQRVKLTFEGNALVGIELYDQLGQHTNVKLSNIKINPSLSARLFQFHPPNGVDVVQQ